MVDGAMSQYLLVGIIAVAIGAAVLAFIYPYIADDRYKDKRLQSVSGQRGARKTGVAAGESQSNRKKSVSDSLKEIETRQKAKEKVTLNVLLLRAGLETTLRDFYIMSAICGLIAGALALVVAQLPWYAACAIAFVFTFGFPRFVLGKLIVRRQNKIVAELANAIDVIVRGVKSGLPLNECIQVVARESPEPLAGEFREVVEQQRLGVSLGEGLERMCDRVPLAEIRFLSIVVNIQQQAGGNLSEALSNLSSVLRDRHGLKMKVKALSAEAKASAMVLGSLPPGVMSLVAITAPHYIQPLFTTTTGQFMLVGSAVWMLTGILMMRKMINFKF